MSNDSFKTNYIEHSINFVKKNIKAFIVLLIIALIFLFGFLLLENLQKKNNIQIAENYSQALLMIKQKKIKESKILLEGIIDKDHQFYSPLSLYLIIDNNIEKEKSKIITYFDKIIKNNSIDVEDINLIKIKKAIYLINLDNEELIIETLNPVINSNSVWRNLAINLISEYFFSKDQKIKAEEYIRLLNNKTRN
jgi:predicted negative regulator of RcsB-dependent stress response